MITISVREPRLCQTSIVCASPRPFRLMQLETLTHLVARSSSDLLRWGLVVDPSSPILSCQTSALPSIRSRSSRSKTFYKRLKRLIKRPNKQSDSSGHSWCFISLNSSRALFSSNGSIKKVNNNESQLTKWKSASTWSTWRIFPSWTGISVFFLYLGVLWIITETHFHNTLNTSSDSMLTWKWKRGCILKSAAAKYR